jgi:hypothetical protein
MGQRWLDGYSAQVEIYLLIDGKRFEVAQIGAGALVLRGESTIPPNTEAKLVIKIDGVEERDTIVICNGSEVSRQELQYF